MIAMGGLSTHFPHSDIAIVLAAVALDLVLGDPRALPHPVTAIGKLVSALESPLRRLFTNARLAGVALLLSNGLHALPESARWGLLWGGLAGIVITLCERLWPKSRKFLPSATAMGIAFVIPAYNSVSMFIGAFIAWVLEKRAPAFGDTYTVPVASGLIAGESLMGIAVAMLIAFQFM